MANYILNINTNYIIWIFSLYAEVSIQTQDCFAHFLYNLPIILL